MPSARTTRSPRRSARSPPATRSTPRSPVTAPMPASSRPSGPISTATRRYTRKARTFPPVRRPPSSRSASRMAGRPASTSSKSRWTAPWSRPANTRSSDLAQGVRSSPRRRGSRTRRDHPRASLPQRKRGQGSSSRSIFREGGQAGRDASRALFLFRRHTPVETIEARGPGPAVVLRGFPQLAHAAIGIGRPADALALGRAGLYVRRFTGAGQNHAFAFEAALQMQADAGLVDPELLPTTGGRVVKIETLARESGGAGPVLEDHAGLEDPFDPALPRLGPVGLADVPLANPEIELAVRGRRTGRRRGRWHLGHGERRHEHAGEQEQARKTLHGGDPCGRPATAYAGARRNACDAGAFDKP